MRTRPPGARRIPLGRLALGLLVGLLVAMWFYAFFLAASGNPDRMEDRSWPEAAEARCTEADELLSGLRPAAETPTPAARGDDLDAATDILDRMLADLKRLDGGTHDDRILLTHWFSDWDTYLADRRAHAERLRTEGDVRPLMSALPGGTGSVLERMNGFARVNDMEGCLDPGDL